MSQSSTAFIRGGLAVLAGVSLAFSLTACGGGGDATETPPPGDTEKKGVLSVSTCVVEAGKTSCSLSASASGLQNVTTAMIEAVGQQFPGPGPVVVEVSLGQALVVLTGDGVKLDDELVTVGCATGLVPQGTTCVQLTASGTLSVSTATVADEAKTATVAVLFTSSNATALSVTLGSETKDVPAGSGQVTFVRAGIEDLPVSLKDNGSEIASAVSQASCSSNAAWDGPWTKCRVILPSYEDYVVGIWGSNGVPYIVNKAGATPAVNQTPWQLPTATPFFCGLRKVNNPDLWGYVHGSCQDSVTLKERPFMINPQTGELTLSSPIDPYSPEYVVGNPVDYRYADPGDASYTLGPTEAKVTDGTFYTAYSPTDPDDSSIYFMGNDSQNIVISKGTIQNNGNVNVLQTFLHTKP
jgi:hypothetical protein